MKGEIDQYLEQNPETLRAFSDTFIARQDTYPYQLPDGSYTRAHHNHPDGSKTYYPFTMQLLEHHLKGERTLGAYILNPKSYTSRIILDDDSDQGLERLHNLSRQWQTQNIPSYLEQSRRGGHLWLFTPPLTGRDARRIGKYLLGEQGLTTQDIELYPKQEFLHGDQVGSLLRLPFGRHRLTGQVYGFLDPNGRPLAPRLRDQLERLSQPERVPQPIIDNLLAAAPAAARHFGIDRQRLKSYSPTLPPDEKIKRAMSPRDFISQYVDINSQGRGLCPFHDDHKMSLAVYEDGWHCFAGCEGQTVIDFYIRWQGYPSLKLPAAEWKQVLAELLHLLGF